MNELTLLERPPSPAVAPRPRRTRRLMVAAASVAALTAGITVVVTAAGHAAGLGPTAFAVTTQPHGKIAIRVVSTKASAQQMTNQLHAHGLNITVQTVPASSQLVGTWVELAGNASVSNALMAQLGDQAIGHATTIVMPARFTGSLTFDIARTPAPGEAVQVGGIRNALAPSGPLACQGLSGATPAAARQTLAALGYTITGWSDSPSDDNPTTAPPAGTRVVQTFIDDISPTDATKTIASRDHDVIVDVTAPSDRLYQTRLHSGFAPSQTLNAC
jgi:hypothetical protein